jgi:hypothetical protein
MATVNSGNTLSLNNLAAATDESTKSLGTVAGSTSTPISMSAFAIDSVGSLSGFTYVVESTAEDYVLGFGGAGGRFEKISQQKKNFDWSVTNIDATATSLFSSASYSQAAAGSGSITLTAGDMANSGVLIGATAHTLGVTFADGYNDHIGADGNYNQARTKTIYSVDSYDGNAAALCLVSDSPIMKSDGTIVEVGDLSAGDVLNGYSLSGLSEDSDGNFLEWESDSLGETQKNVTVVNVTYSFSNKIYNINDGQIKGTSEHPMLVKDKTDGKYKFKELVRLELEDKLIKEVDSVLTEVEITSIIIEAADVEIVSLDVEAQDTYLVNGYVTHNKGSNSHTDLAAPGAPTDIAFNNGTKILSWVAPSSVGTTGITAYNWDISTTSNFSAAGQITNGSQTQWSATTIATAALSLPSPHLAAGTEYYFRVQAIDQGLPGTYGNLTFTPGAG